MMMVVFLLMFRAGHLGTGLDDERTVATKINVFKAVLDNSNILLDNGNNRVFVDTGCF